MEKKKYDSFIYSLPFKTGAIILSLVFLVFGIASIMLFAELWDKGIYSMNYMQITEYIGEHARKDYLGSLWLFEMVISIRNALLPIGIILGILYLIDIVFIFASVGHARGGEKLAKFPTSDFPIELTCILYALFFSIVINVNERRVNNDFSFKLLFMLITLVIFYFAFLSLCLNIVINLKTRTLFKNMLIVRFFRHIFKEIERNLSDIGIVKKVILYFGIFAVSEIFIIFIFYYVVRMSGANVLFNLLIIINLFVIFEIYRTMTGLRDIETAQQNIISGKVDYKLNESEFKGDLRVMAANLNKIATGLENALNERMKSERFKTELITNVSHDIKTPLTSIINYTDLLKKEKIETEPIKGYVEVLDRQSERLKKLITDLIEASKASSGSIKMNFSSVNVGLMIEQVYGEFQDRFEKAGLTGIIKQPDDEVNIKADANHLFRVFDNILSNVVKYAQPDTRVYIDIIKKENKEENKVSVVFKNISKEKLNITGEELMERFVRGDRSRNTEGSGLGLSIAKSLVNLMNGELKIVIDGDLFKVEVQFNEIQS